jgi:hypothetical protein
VIRRKLTDSEFWFDRHKPFGDELAQHADEDGMSADCRSADHFHAELDGEILGFGIEIKQNLQVI